MLFVSFFLLFMFAITGVSCINGYRNADITTLTRTVGVACFISTPYFGQNDMNATSCSPDLPVFIQDLWGDSSHRALQVGVQHYGRKRYAQSKIHSRSVDFAPCSMKPLMIRWKVLPL